MAGTLSFAAPRDSSVRIPPGSIRTGRTRAAYALTIFGGRHPPPPPLVGKSAHPGRLQPVWAAGATAIAQGGAAPGAPLAYLAAGGIRINIFRYKPTVYRPHFSPQRALLVSAACRLAPRDSRGGCPSSAPATRFGAQERGITGLPDCMDSSVRPGAPSFSHR